MSSYRHLKVIYVLSHNSELSKTCSAGCSVAIVLYLIGRLVGLFINKKCNYLVCEFILVYGIQRVLWVYLVK